MINYTPVCWSVAMQMRSMTRDWGKADKTLCGMAITGAWDYDVHDYPPYEFCQCLRCRKVLKALESRNL